MADVFEKTPDNQLKVIKTEEVIRQYNIDELIKQRLQIEKQRDEFTAARNIEIDEVDTLIAEAKKLGIEATTSVEAEIIKP